MKYLWIVLPILCGLNGFAQLKPIEKIAAACSTGDLKKNLYYLASPEMKGRLMGSHEDTLASLYIIDRFKQTGIKAPYQNGTSYFQAITTQRETGRRELVLNDKTWFNLDGWEVFPNKPINLQNIGVVFTDYDDLALFSKEIPELDVSGKAVIINLQLYAKNPPEKVDALWTLLKNAGAKLIVFGSPGMVKRLDDLKEEAFTPQYKLPFYYEDNSAYVLPELALTPDKYKELLNSGTAGKSGRHFVTLKGSISVTIERDFTPEQAPNVIGVLKGTDTTLACVVLSAHHDHDGMNGKQVMYGAVDNASGVATIMQIATMLNKAAKQGLRPKRTIIFASFTGEERGLLGAQWYVDHPLVPMKKTHAVLNLDMLGRTDTLHGNKKPDSANYAYILVKDSLNRGLRNSLVSANKTIPKLVLDPYYENPKYTQRRLQGSDQYPFYLEGVPFIRIDCGFSRDYHKPTDTPDKINYPLLTRQTQLTFLTLWNLANN